MLVSDDLVYGLINAHRLIALGEGRSFMQIGINLTL
jgi:hypothetical protein